MCSLGTDVVTVNWPLLKVVTLAIGSLLAIAALSLIAHNLVLILQQPDSTFRKVHSGQLCCNHCNNLLGIS